MSVRMAPIRAAARHGLAHHACYERPLCGAERSKGAALSLIAALTPSRAAHYPHRGKRLPVKLRRVVSTETPAPPAGIREDELRTVGIAMNGVTGRMGTNQHLVRSILAIRRQGGVRVPGGPMIWPEPVLVGRSEPAFGALAGEHGLERFTTSLDEALSDPSCEVYFDAAATSARADGHGAGHRRRQARLLREALGPRPRHGPATRPTRPRGGGQARRGAGQALPARPAQAAHAARQRLLRADPVGAW